MTFQELVALRDRSEHLRLTENRDAYREARRDLLNAQARYMEQERKRGMTYRQLADLLRRA